jgi:hypothetical protein
MSPYTPTQHNNKKKKGKKYFHDFFFVFKVLGIKPMASHIVGKCSTT